MELFLLLRSLFVALILSGQLTATESDYTFRWTGAETPDSEVEILKTNPNGGYRTKRTIQKGDWWRGLLSSEPSSPDRGSGSDPEFKPNNKAPPANAFRWGPTDSNVDGFGRPSTFSGFMSHVGLGRGSGSPAVSSVAVNQRMGEMGKIPPVDARGHIVAAASGGSGSDPANIFPQNSQINNGPWKKQEQQVRANVQKYGPATVKYKLHYASSDPSSPDYARPAAISCSLSRPDGANCEGRYFATNPRTFETKEKSPALSFVGNRRHSFRAGTVGGQTLTDLGNRRHSFNMGNRPWSNDPLQPFNLGVPNSPSGNTRPSSSRKRLPGSKKGFSFRKRGPG